MHADKEEPMANEAIAKIEKEISRDRELLALLESGKVESSDIEAQIYDLKRKIAINETLLDKYGA